MEIYFKNNIKAKEYFTFRLVRKVMTKLSFVIMNPVHDFYDSSQPASLILPHHMDEVVDPVYGED